MQAEPRRQLPGGTLELDRGISAWFDLWHEPLRVVVQRSVTRSLADAGAAEETVQEVMLEVWSKAERIQAGPGSPEAWAITIARRRAIDRIRSDRSRVAREHQDHRRTPQKIDFVAEDVVISIDRERVRDAMGALNHRQREAIVLAFFGDRTYADVATFLGIPLGTVKRRIRDGMTKMRPLLAQIPDC